jgi:hypothetical protein
MTSGQKSKKMFQVIVISDPQAINDIVKYDILSSNELLLHDTNLENSTVQCCHTEQQ